MTAPIDETDFIDRDLLASQSPRPTLPAAPAHPAIAPRPPTREELDVKVGEAQNRIAELKRAADELERERAALEEARRRRQEFEAGRGEMLEHLTRGVGLLEKAEFEARRDAEQMAKTLSGFRDALTAVQAVREEAWTQENWRTELTKALTVVENARMEWNSARLKWPLLNGATDTAGQAPTGAAVNPAGAWLAQQRFGDLGRLGLALTWPLAAAFLLALGALVILLVRR